MIDLTTEETRALEDALWKAAEGIRETQKVLAQIGTRLGLEFQGGANHVRDIAGFIANSARLRSSSDHVAQGFAEDRHWKS